MFKKEKRFSLKKQVDQRRRTFEGKDIQNYNNMGCWFSSTKYSIFSTSSIKDWFSSKKFHNVIDSKIYAHKRDKKNKNFLKKLKIFNKSNIGPWCSSRNFWNVHDSNTSTYNRDIRRKVNENVEKPYGYFSHTEDTNSKSFERGISLGGNCELEMEMAMIIQQENSMNITSSPILMKRKFFWFQRKRKSKEELDYTIFKSRLDKPVDFTPKKLISLPEAIAGQVGPSQTPAFVRNMRKTLHMKYLELSRYKPKRKRFLF